MCFLSALISSPETWISSLNFTRCLSARSHGWLFIYCSGFCLLFSPCNVCLCGRWRPHVLLPDKISPKLSQGWSSSEACIASGLHCTLLYRCVWIEYFQLTAVLFVYLVAPGPWQAYDKSDLRSRHQTLFFLSVTPVHTSQPLPLIRCQAWLQNQPGKSENKNLKCIFPFFLHLSLDFSLTASSISFERILKCQIKLSQVLCSQSQGLVQFFYGVWIHAVGLIHVSI